jgi:hypothetical protein
LPAETWDGVVSPPLEAVESGGTGGGGLWQTPVAGESPETTHVPGMWTGPESTGGPQGARNQHGGSVRARPWGPVPGLREPAGRLRGIRASRS